MKAITGQILNGVLSGMVSALGKGYTVAGEANPETDPGTMTGPVAYIAHTAGTYEHFGNLVVEQGEVAMLIFDENTWTKNVLASLSADATVDDNIGTPGVNVSFVDGVLTFNFRNLKGDPGENGQDGQDGRDGQDGAAAGFGTVTASVDANVGTPGVTVQTSGPNTAKNFAFQFTNLKGETGVTSCVVTVDNTSGNPACAVSLVGQVLHLDFTGLKGAQGNTGSSVDYPFTIVNNLTTDDATQALSAAMGVELAGQVSQLEAKVTDLDSRFDSYNSAVNNYSLNKRNELWPAFAFDSKYKLVEDKIDANYLTPTLRFCPKTYPSIFWGKKEFAFTKGTVATAQVKAQKRFVIRELSDIHFEGWLKFGDKLGTSKVTQVIEIQLKKQYPANGNETTFAFSISENTDYSNVATTPITTTVTNSLVGDVSIVFDDYLVSEDGWFVHFYIDKDFGNTRYANLNIVYYNGNAWISANGSIYMSASLVNPMLTSTKPFAPDGYEDVSNIAYDSVIHSNVNSGNAGKPLETPTKRLLTPVVGPHQYTVVDNKRSFDLVFSNENGIVTSQSQPLLEFVPSYYYKQFPSGKLYIQFALDFDVLQHTKGNPSGLYTRRQQIMDCRWALTPGAKIGTNNDYANNTWQVVDVSDDARCTVRFSIDTPADGTAWSGSYQLDFLFRSTNTDDLTEATFYDFCVSDKPLIVGGDHRGPASLKFPNVVGKSLMLFGDSEHNTGECLLDTAAKLGLRAYDCHYGGHSFGWSANNWLYDWNYRQYVLQTKADFYIFCASTNDAGVVNIEQLSTDESVNAVRNNYPCFGDTDAQITEKLALYNAMSDAQKTAVFNMTSCICAYVEQILESNPQAKIILANSPITCSGLLTGTLSASNRGQWASGQTPASARSGKAPIFAKLDECMRTVAERYNLPVLDFLHGVALTFNNFTEYCVDGTHWLLDDQTYIDGSTSVLRNNHKILMREGEILTEYISGKGV